MNKGGSFLMNWKNTEDHFGHNDYGVREGKFPGYFYIVIGNEGGELLFLPISQKFGMYHPRRERLARKLFHMEEMQM